MHKAHLVRLSCGPMVCNLAVAHPSCGPIGIKDVHPETALVWAYTSDIEGQNGQFVWAYGSDLIWTSQGAYKRAPSASQGQATALGRQGQVTALGRHP